MGFELLLLIMMLFFGIVVVLEMVMFGLFGDNGLLVMGAFPNTSWIIRDLGVTLLEDLAPLAFGKVVLEESLIGLRFPSTICPTTRFDCPGSLTTRTSPLGAVASSLASCSSGCIMLIDLAELPLPCCVAFLPLLFWVALKAMVLVAFTALESSKLLMLLLVFELFATMDLP